MAHIKEVGITNNLMFLVVILNHVDLLNDKNEIITGFYRDNCCNTGPDDFGLHTVCCIMTKSFLTFQNQLEMT